MSDPAGDAIAHTTFVADQLQVTATRDGLLFHFSFASTDAPAILFRPWSDIDLADLRAVVDHAVDTALTHDPELLEL